MRATGSVLGLCVRLRASCALSRLAARVRTPVHNSLPRVRELHRVVPTDTDRARVCVRALSLAEHLVAWPDEIVHYKLYVRVVEDVFKSGIALKSRLSSSAGGSRTRESAVTTFEAPPPPTAADV